MFFGRKRKLHTHNVKKDSDSKKIYAKFFDQKEFQILIAVSAFNGIVYYDEETGKLRSGSPEKICANFGFYYTDGGVKFLYFDHKNKISKHLISDGIKEEICFSEYHDGILVNTISTTCDGIGFQSSGLNMICLPDGDISFKSKNILNWETYGVISDSALTYFTNKNSDRWIETKSLKFIKFSGFERKDGKTTIDCHAFKIRLSGRPGPVLIKNSETTYFLYESFSESRTLRKYNPLIYLSVSGKDSYFECLRIAVNSIFKFGKYTGKVAIISDREEKEINYLFDNDAKNNIIYFKNSGNDPLFERYKIFEHDISDFSPILYLDADIVVSDDINKFLKNTPDNKSVNLYRERNKEIINIDQQPHHPPENWWGMWMFGQDGEIGKTPFYCATSGIILFNNEKRVSDLFSLIENTSKITRKNMIKHFGDQPFLNYCASQSGMLDIRYLTGKSINGSSMNILMNDPKRFLKHVSLGVGKSESKQVIMREIYNKLLEIEKISLEKDIVISPETKEAGKS